MDFGGVIGMDGSVGGSSIDNGNGGAGGNGLFSPALVSSEINDSIRHRLSFGSSVSSSLKQGRNAGVLAEEQDWRCSKMARSETMPMPTEKGHLPFSSSSFLRSTSNTQSLFPDGQQMLSFSSPKQDSLVPCGDGNLPYYHHLLPPLSCISTAASTYARNTGPNMNINVHGVLAGARGAFTPSQWVELEHQVMIYKYIDANAPIPPTLLIAIKKTQNPFGYATGSLTPTAYGWGSCQLGFSGNSDPEPGRCRRTDGKKWRCSRDAVADQKYCERHMNRGRHRSRKPVEGLTGQAKPMPIIAPSPTTTCSGLIASQQQIKTLQTVSTQPPPSHLSHHTRILMTKDDSSSNVPQSLSMSISTDPATKDDDIGASIPKQYNPFEQSTNRADFVLSAAYNSFLKNPWKNSYMDSTKNQSDRSIMIWPELEEKHTSDRTELSISIPTTCSDLSASSSPTPPGQEKPSLSPLKLSQEMDPIHMGLGIGAVVDNANHHKQGSWAPVSWGASMGGPLGEVLNNSSNNPSEVTTNNNSAVLNLIECWDSSPTGVLQKTSFGSHSSSAGSSPRAADNYNKNQGNNATAANLCDDDDDDNDDLLGYNLVKSSHVPSSLQAPSSN